MNYFPNYTDAYSDYLSHHGILGQKWGVRRFQNTDGSLTAAGRERYGSGPGSATSEPHKKTLAEKRRQHMEETQNKSDKSPLALWSANLALDVALTVANPANAPYLAMDVGRGVIAANGYVKKKSYDKEKATESVDSKTGWHVKSNPEMSKEDDLKRVNPLVYNFDKATKNNCMLCTTAYDIRRRGYDVEAGIARYGYDYADVKKWYPNAELKQVKGYNEKGKLSTPHMIENLKSEIAKQPEGARGNIMVQWKGGQGGHSMIYEVQNGQMVIMDAQVNKKYTDPAKILKKCTGDVTYARLDNVDFDPEKLKGLVK